MSLRFPQLFSRHGPSASRLLVSTFGVCALALGAYAQPATPVAVVVASSSILSIDHDVALNNEGLIAFTGQDSAGSKAFVWDRGSGVRIVSTDVGTGITYRGIGLSSGTKPFIFVRELIAANPPRSILQKWNLNTGAGTVLGDSSLGDFDGATAFCDINGSGICAASVFVNGSSATQVIAGRTRPLLALATYTGTQLLEVQIADNNDVAFRDKNGQIVTWRYPSRATYVIAGAGNGFDSATGHKPGISTDGSTVGFLGTRGHGAGIFVSIADDSGGRSIPPIRIAGENSGDNFTAFVDDQRVGVSSMKFGFGNKYQVVNVVFAGTRNGVTGIYFSTVGILAGQVQTPSPPVKLIAIGEVPDGVTSPIASFELYHPMNSQGQVAFWVTLADGSNAILATPAWQALKHQAPATCNVPILLTDGSVIIQAYGSSQWSRLTPDEDGDYVNGSWSAIASMPTGYGPTFYASAVLADGRVVAIGGEYNLGGHQRVDTKLGSIYNPVLNSWTPLTGQGSLQAPPLWNEVSDAQCCVLPDGRFALADPFNTNMAILNPSTLTWTSTGAFKADRFDEEGWTLMPEGTILTCDAGLAPNAEKYVISTGNWGVAGRTPQSLFEPASEETGPMILMPNGEVLAMGGVGYTAVYTPGSFATDPGTWVAGANFPTDVNGVQLAMADAPGCLLPGGNVLLCTSPGVFQDGMSFFEYDGKNFAGTPGTPNSDSKSCFQGAMLMLPSGQVLFTDQGGDVEIYTPAAMPLDPWRPTITLCPLVVQAGSSFLVKGTQFNGLSQCCAYGDDLSNATNYPLARITNLGTGHVRYARTHDHSTMGVATGSAIVSTHVDLPSNLELGASKLEIVVNGIASKPETIIVSGKAGSGQIG